MMRLDELKKGFWGYKKESVYQYIAAMEDEAARKLVQQQEQAEKEADKAQKRICELEEALKIFREENKALYQDQIHISETLMEAQKYSRKMNEETARRAEEANKEMETAFQVHRDRLEEYGKKVGKLGRVLRELLEDMEAETEHMEEEIGKVKEQAPAHGLAVFPKKPGNGRQESA